MSIFAVILDSPPDPKIVANIKKSYPDNNYAFSDTVFFVSGNQIADDVSRTIGINGDDDENPALGAVFRLNHSFAGYTRRALWDWIVKAEKEGLHPVT